MTNNKEKTINCENSFVLFQEINRWLQHLDHILWTVTSLMGTLNVLIIWKCITKKEIINMPFIKWSYFILTALNLFFSISIGIVSIRLARLLEDRNLTRERFREAVEFRLRYLFSPISLEYILFKPWGVVTLTYTALSFYCWWKFFLN